MVESHSHSNAQRNTYGYVDEQDKDGIKTTNMDNNKSCPSLYNEGISVSSLSFLANWCEVLFKIKSALKYLLKKANVRFIVIFTIPYFRQMFSLRIGRWQQILCPRLFLQEDNITFPQIYLVTGYDDIKQLTYILKTPVPNRFFSLFLTQSLSHRLGLHMLPVYFVC